MLMEGEGRPKMILILEGDICLLGLKFLSLVELLTWVLLLIYIISLDVILNIIFNGAIAW